MFTEKHYLEHITDRELDTYLAKGWYRMGQAVFTCRFIIFKSLLYSAIWVRLPLEGFQFKKRLRKLLRNNYQKFKVTIGPAVIDAEKEALYQRYRNNFNGRLAPSLKISLLDDTDHNMFDTLQVCVYDGSRLVAFSFFDKGYQAMASILGVFDPAYEKHSLGFFTMLVEMDYCLQLGFKYYYPGYIVPGYGKFDYKLRIGDVEYYDERSDAWVSAQEYEQMELPSNLMFRKLDFARRQLQKQQIAQKLTIYPPYEANLLGYWILDYLEYPIFLQCGGNSRQPIKLILVYDHLKESYALCYCTIYDDLSDFFIGEVGQKGAALPLELELLIKEEVLLEDASLDNILEAIKHEGGNKSSSLLQF